MKRRRFRSQRKSMYISLVILLFVFISVGYSYLSKTLNIAGNIAVTKTTWDVHFENATKIDGNIDLTSGFSYTYNDTTLSLGLSFSEPGQYFEFEVDVVNNGSIDAMLGSTIQDKDGVLSQNGRSNYLEYSVTYDDGIPLTVKDSLPKKKSDKLKVRIAFKENVTESQLPSNNDNFTVTFQATYVQDDGTSHERGVAGAKMLIKKANAANTTYAGVGTVKQKEMFAFDHDATEQTPVLTDYRYIGNSPNNYINFNDEIWRIIGVFDGKIKIIMDSGIENTNISWDYKYSTASEMVGSADNERGWGSNDWSDAQLMYLLNKPDIDRVLKAKVGYKREGDLIKDANGKVIYRLGYLPAKQESNTSSYSGSNIASWSLKESALAKVSRMKWYLGGEIWHYNGYSWGYGTAEEMYQAERGIKTCYTEGQCQIERPISWEGRVGLMYASDYGYTFGKGVNDTCYNGSHYCRSGDNSWLYNSNWSQWMISTGTSPKYFVMTLHSTGGGGADATYDSYAYSEKVVRPVVFLKSNIRLQGSGSSSDPYVIVD